MVWLSFGVGLFLGTFAGILLVGLLSMNRKNNKKTKIDHYQDYIKSMGDL